MEPLDTAASYDRLARIWASDAVHPMNGIKQHERAITFSRKAGSAIDIGCGSNGRIIEFLLANGFAVDGLDLSTEMLVLAKQRHPAVHFYHADICTWEAPRQYDFISAWDSIWHVPLDRQAAVLTKLCAALNPGGVLIFTSGGTDAPGEAINPDCYGQRLYHAAPGLGQLLRLIDQAHCSCRHLEYDQDPEGHLYLIVKKL